MFYNFIIGLVTVVLAVEEENLTMAVVTRVIKPRHMRKGYSSRFVFIYVCACICYRASGYIPKNNYFKR